MNDQDRIDFWIDAERGLTTDEFRLLRLLADGYTCRDIAQMSTYGRQTVYNRYEKIYIKLQQKLDKTL